MGTERWILNPEVRSTMERLNKIAGTRSVAETEFKPRTAKLDSNHSVPSSISLEVRGPANSTVAAGWICCAFGLLCAWIFPLAHLFFPAAFILSIVAMSTHQVRRGTILMIATLAGSAACVIVSLLMITTTARVFADRFHDRFPVMVPTSEPATALPPTHRVPGRVADNPLTIDDLAILLRVGYSDDEVIAAVQQKQLVKSIDAARVSYLRSLGAGDKLVRSLRGRPTFIAPARSSSPVQGTVTVWDPLPSLPAIYQPGPVATPGMVSSAPVINYQEKDRRIKDLADRINALDEDVRRVRSNPKDARYWWRYAGRDNGINQQSLDNYLKQLDEQRNNLRRERWQLEGR